MENQVVEKHGADVFDEDDLMYEDEVLRNQYSVKHWFRYIEHKKNSPDKDVNRIYERALKELPGSYKLWYSYLKHVQKEAKKKEVVSYETINNIFEKSLVFMHKMLRIWIDYCQFMVPQCNITRTRHLFDRALRALPITQHHRIWPFYLKFVKKYNIPETAVRIYRRYLKLCPEDAEDFIEYLTSIDRLDDAALKLTDIVNNEKFVSKHGKSNHQLWNELCELISKNPDKITSLNVDAIIRGGLRRYTDQLGHLWNSLADYYVRSGLFERARDIYEEAIDTVATVRDFTQVFDAYSQFEELILNRRMEEVADQTNVPPELEVEIELRFARLEDLINRRSLLLNSVLLRQNPHNCLEWHNRVKLFEGKPREIVKTYTDAIQTVDPKLAVGKLHTLWVEFAKFYEKNGQLDDARIIFERATLVPYTKVDDLASVWCEWAEMEMRDNYNYEKALKLIRSATTLPVQEISYHDDSHTVQDRLYKCLKLWCLYADLEESYGTFKTCKAVYDRIIDLKIATPQIIMNYALYLEEQNYFEESYRAFEKGISLFKWPNVYDLWTTYLDKFIKRYRGTKLERARDLFEQCLQNCPAKFAKHLYLLYAKLEEDYGLRSQVMNVYERATTAVLPEEQFEMYNVYIKKAAEIFGVPKTREIYQKAIEELDEDHSRQMCLRFADLETKLGEIDRARAIYIYCSQSCDPRVTEKEFWETWTNFEVKHGNEDTLREMLRIKRSVQACYNTQVNMMSAQMLAAASNAPVTASNVTPAVKDDSMRMLEAKAIQMSSADRIRDIMKKDNISFVRGETLNAETESHTNPDEINIDDADDEDEDKENDDDDDDEEGVKLPVKEFVPAEVFGSLGKIGRIEKE